MNSKKYDVIIIGAGIGGLVCGCYLAKAGKKVLIVEKNKNVGGCCCSFKRGGFTFDACVHSLGNLSEGGQLYNILKDFGIFDEISFKRFNPSDTIIASEYKLSFWNDLDKTVDEWTREFPKESPNIRRFFTNILNEENIKYAIKIRKKTFKDVLDSLFCDNKLKKILSVPILGNLGVPSNLINAFTAVKHYKQFLIDGGFYPEKGIQSFSNALANKFISLNGKIIMGKAVKKIIIENNLPVGVSIEDNRVFMSDYVVSDCDAKQTFFDFVGTNFLSKEMSSKLRLMKPSLGVFVVYLGLKKVKKNSSLDGRSTWIILDSDCIDKNSINLDLSDIKWIMFKYDRENKTCLLYANAPLKDEKFWKSNKTSYAQKIISIAENYIEDLRDSIDFMDSSSPNTLYKWTKNFKGAAYGWASISRQFMDPDFARDKIIRNLFISGHWSTVASGVPGVAINGKRIAKIINSNK